MRRFWGVLLSWAIFTTLCADETAATRTPHGMLWAGTTFTLQAVATYGNIASNSSTAQVRVGQVYHWQMQMTSPRGASVPSGDALFRFQLTNLGNGYDSPRFEGWHLELTETRVWQVSLFEDRNSNGMPDGSEQISNQGSLLSPVGVMGYVLRMRPPSSSTPTDGAWAGVAVRSFAIMGGSLIADYVAGVLRELWYQSRGSCLSGQSMLVPGVYVAGRAFWMGTDSNNITRLFYTPNRLDQAGGTFSSNRATYGRALNFVPDGWSVAVDNGWFVGTSDGRLLRIDLTRILNNDTSADPYQQVNLPNGVQARRDLQPIMYRSRLYLVGSDNRVHVISSAGTWLSQSARPSSAVGTISCPPLLTSRAIVVGTSQGYVVAFDLVTGGIRLARQVATEPIKSLAVTADERLLLAQIGSARIVALTALQGTTYWTVSLPDVVVSPLAYEPDTDLVLVLTRSGWLYAFSGSTGMLASYYPQQVFSGQPLERATIATLRRTDRKSPYAYVLAQQRISGSSATQPRMAMVTVRNPYNRYEAPESALGSQADYLPAIRFTGDAIGSFCLVFQKQAYTGTTTQGLVVAFPVL